MSPLVRVDIHSSQFPERVRGELLEGLQARRLNHKFHYDSIKQTTRWLALHEAYSPFRTDPDCAATYERCFGELQGRSTEKAVLLVGLGCGGGGKDAQLIQRLRAQDREVGYLPLDVSTSMVLVAHRTATALIPASRCFPLVCDLAVADDLPEQLARRFSEKDAEGLQTCPRIFTFFGMIPNFEPQVILPKLAKLVRPADYLLFSANLAPGSDYDAGVKQVLPLYNNELTREWLMVVLSDLGVERGDGVIRFSIENDSGLKRITASFEFSRRREIQVETERFVFTPGEAIRLFFSYRHTPALVRSLLQGHGLEVQGEWITASGEEGVFLVRPR